MDSFDMEKDSNEPKGGFGFGITGSESDTDHLGSDSLPNYLDIEVIDNGVYRLQYTEKGKREEVAEIDTNNTVEVSEAGSDFSSADYQHFLERAGEVLSEENQIDNAYTLLE